MNCTYISNLGLAVLIEYQHLITTKSYTCMDDTSNKNKGIIQSYTGKSGISLAAGPGLYRDLIPRKGSCSLFESSESESEFGHGLGRLCLAGRPTSQPLPWHKYAGLGGLGRSMLVIFQGCRRCPGLVRSRIMLHVTLSD